MKGVALLASARACVLRCSAEKQTFSDPIDGAWSTTTASRPTRRVRCRKNDMTREAEAAAERKRAPSPGRISRRSLLIIGGGVLGGSMAGGLVGSLVGAKSGSTGGTDAARMEIVPTASLPQVQGTLSPEQAAQLTEEARRCRAPLGRVTVWQSPAASVGQISIVSGSYESPHFTLTAAPRLIALPYPAPYATGKGVLTLVGEASDMIISLMPQRTIIDLKGALPIPVWWTPVTGCP